MAALNCVFLIHMRENFTKMKELFKHENAITKRQIKKSIRKGIKLTRYMISKIEHELQLVENSNDYFRLLGMVATLLFEQSKQYLKLGKQRKAEHIWRNIYREFKDDILRPELGYVILRVFYHLAFYVHTTDLARAQDYLEESEWYYYQMVQSNPTFSWYTSNEVFSSLLKVNFQLITKEKFEKLILYNLDFLSWIYNRQNDVEKHVLYEHNVLSNQIITPDTDHTQWSRRVSRLATILLDLGMFKDAQHHLAAATCVIEEHSSNLASFLESSDFFSMKYETQRAFTELSRCWVKYGIKLLNVSKYNLLKQKYSEHNNVLYPLWTAPKEIVETVKSSQDVLRTKEGKSMESMNMLEQINNSDDKYIERVDVSNSNESSHGQIKSNNDILLEEEEFDVIDERIKETIEAMKGRIHNIREITSNMTVKIRNVGEATKEIMDNLREVASNMAVNVSKVNEATKESIDNLSMDRSKMAAKVNEDVNGSNDNLSLDRANTTINGEEINKITEHLKLVKDSDEDSTHTSFIDTDDLEVETFTLPEKNLIFTTIGTSVFENKVTDELIMTFNQANDLFLFTHFWVKKLKDVYKFHVHPQEYINAVLDLNELYRLLGFFSNNIEAQYKIQKERMDTLEGLHVLIKGLKPDIYMRLCIDLVQELSEIQVELLRLNMCRLNTTQMNFNEMEAMTDIRSRFNSYKESSWAHFDQFVSEDIDSGKSY